jgi:ribosomal protein S18 acetylase RimI-like enzyme
MPLVKTFTVARVLPQDSEVLRQLRISFVENAPTAILGDPGYMRKLPARAWQSLARHLAASDSQAAFLAWADGIAVGLVQVSYREHTCEAEVTHLWVCREHRRKGVARELLSTAVEFAATHEPRAVTLWVSAGNSQAESLYRNAGFCYTGKSRPFEPDSECVQHELAFRL